MPANFDGMTTFDAAGKERPPLGTLGAILATPPMTSGDRTLARLELAKRILCADGVVTANLLNIPTRDTNQVSSLGKNPASWNQSRAKIEECVFSSQAILLGFGVTRPSGEAGVHFQSQVAWLRELLVEHGAVVYLVGGRPRHPSRWQRWTARAQPGVPFDEALGRELNVTSIVGAAASLGLPARLP